MWSGCKIGHTIIDVAYRILAAAIDVTVYVCTRITRNIWNDACPPQFYVQFNLQFNLRFRTIVQRHFARSRQYTIVNFAMDGDIVFLCVLNSVCVCVVTQSRN